MALILEGVTAGYATGTSLASRALDDVSLKLAPGEMTVVLGPSGSGKTTMLRVASGLLPLIEGRVAVDGNPVSGRGSTPGTVALVFQRPESQFFSLTVLEDCMFGPRNLGRTAEEATSDARAALASVGLDPDDFGPREPWSLSGGEARRAALAGVLAMRPSYLLLDEPTAGLDHAGREAVRTAVAAAKREAGVMIVTHDPEVFLDAADRVMVIRDGRGVFEGTTGEYLSRLPVLTADSGIEAPDVPKALLLAAEHGMPLSPSDLTLDPSKAADLLARAVLGGAA